MMHYYGHMGYGWIFQIVIILLFFGVVWWMVKSSSSFGYKSSDDSAYDILKKRLAAGEIDIKEFKRLKKEIEHGD